MPIPVIRSLYTNIGAEIWIVRAAPMRTYCRNMPCGVFCTLSDTTTRAVRPYFLHDYLYRNAELHTPTRAQSDEILYCALRAGRAAKSRSRIIYAGARVFGRFRVNTLRSDA